MPRVLGVRWLISGPLRAGSLTMAISFLSERQSLHLGQRCCVGSGWSPVGTGLLTGLGTAAPWGRFMVCATFCPSLASQPHNCWGHSRISNAWFRCTSEGRAKLAPASCLPFLVCSHILPLHHWCSDKWFNQLYNISSQLVEFSAALLLHIFSCLLGGHSFTSHLTSEAKCFLMSFILVFL